jgi:hypothetical protein
LVLVALIAAVAILVATTRPRDARLLDALDAASRDQKSMFDADLSEFFPGAWDRAVILCRGATSPEAEAALGFHWFEGAQLESSAFLSTILFVEGDVVKDTLSIGPDSGWVYVPCPIDSGSWGEGESPTVAVVSRSRAVIPFTHHHDPDSDFWYVEASAFERLAVGRF